MSSVLPPLGGPGLPLGQGGVIAAIACVALFGIGQGMTHPLFALRLEQAGWSSGMIGLSGAMVAVAALTAAPAMPRLIRLIGLPAFLMAGCVLSAAMLVTFPAFESYGAWLVLRYLQGVAATALFLGSEAWIVGGSEDGSRGRVVGFYATVLSLGFALGPLILSGTGFEGALPFYVCAAVSLVAVAPLVTAWTQAPRAEPGDAPAVAPLRFLRTDPTVMGAVILFGAIEFGVMAMLPVWGVKIGLGADAAAFLVSTLVLGNVALQLPLGALADRLNRRAMLAGCAAVSIVSAASLPFLAGGGWMLWAVLFVWGGLAAGLYTIALIELGSRYAGQTLVSANAAVIIAYGIGALGGPVLVGAAMDAIEPHGLAIALALMASAYLVVTLMRWRQRAEGRRG